MVRPAAGGFQTETKDKRVQASPVPPPRRAEVQLDADISGQSMAPRAPHHTGWRAVT